ncbi:MAG: hypothetical protein ACRD1R_00040 [Acidobacteriota bacterium]
MVVALFTLLLSLTLPNAGFSIAPRTILVYENVSGKIAKRFIIRVARYQPDIFLEWESTSHQGTLHLYREAVHEADQFNLIGLFEVGVDLESEEATTIWLSRAMYQDLLDDGYAQIRLNSQPVKLQVQGEGSYNIVVDKEPAQVPIIRVKDNRRGEWVFLKDPVNPLLIEYVTPYFRQTLKRISTDPENDLRWVREIPPVK